ncbi:MAG: DNA alkylation repair protein [Terriglobia bacterium]
MNCAEILRRLASRPDPQAVAGMARFGIVAKKVYGGWSTPALKRFAREIGRNHALAQELWASGIFEARALATLIDDPDKFTGREMDDWAKDFDNWATCDGACINVFRYTRFAHQKCVEWSTHPAEFVKRAAFALMASLTVADKTASNEAFLRFLPLIKAAAADERNGVRKGVNWALRQIGKRNAPLNRAALAVAHEIHRLDSRAARWIASDAIRELESPAVQHRLKLHSAAPLERKIKRRRAKAASTCRSALKQAKPRHVLN